MKKVWFAWTVMTTTVVAMLWMEGATSHRIRTSSDHHSLVLSFPPDLVARATGWIEASGLVHDLVARVGEVLDPARRDRLTAVLVDELVEPLPLDARFERVVGLVAQRPALTAAAIARGVGMSERSFRRWFRDDVGTSFTAWHRQRLVERAVAQLRRGDSVKAVAADLGYTSPSAFHHDVRARHRGDAGGRDPPRRRRREPARPRPGALQALSSLEAWWVARAGRWHGRAMGSRRGGGRDRSRSCVARGLKRGGAEVLADGCTP